MTVLKKSKLRLYNSVVLKDVKKVVFTILSTKKVFKQHKIGIFGFVFKQKFFKYIAKVFFRFYDKYHFKTNRRYLFDLNVLDYFFTKEDKIILFLAFFKTLGRFLETVFGYKKHRLTSI